MTGTPVAKSDDEMQSRFKEMMLSERGLLHQTGLLFSRLDRLSKLLEFVNSGLADTATLKHMVRNITGERVDRNPRPQHFDLPQLMPPFEESYADMNADVRPEALQRSTGAAMRGFGQMHDHPTITLRGQSEEQAAYQPTDVHQLLSLFQRAGLPPTSASLQEVIRLMEDQERSQQLQSQDLPPPTRLALNIQAHLPREAVSSQGWFGPESFASSSLSRSPVETQAIQAGFASMSANSNSQQGSAGQAGQRPRPADRSTQSMALLREFRARATELQGPTAAREAMPRGRGTATRRAQAGSNPPAQGELGGMAEYPGDDPEEQTLPSYGSSGHYVGACKPCLFWYHQMCLKGHRCDYCHILHNQDEVKKVRPSKATRTLLLERGSRSERPCNP